MEAEKAIENIFTYHAPKNDQKERYEKIRNKAKEMAYLINKICPDCAEKYEALKNLRISIMWANAGIACNE